MPAHQPERRRLDKALVHDSKLTVNDPNPEASHRPVGGEFVGIRHRSIFGSREPGVPREVVAMA